ncbi:hypothetical protein TUM4438_45490 [Shewanella sairae]|uniref:TraH protein n=1 Tax=Shewanella sairae TaxID=190310 RepID=A0ABQ4PS38_9GAMM|nr:hypothetical protein TUM4438_45490 [Shewanella sairae]
MDSHEKTDEELLEEAMMSLDEPLPDMTEVDEGMSADNHNPNVSPTLEALEVSRRPQGVTVCETCPNSVWQASKDKVQCYCRVMYLVTWDSNDPETLLTHCDGEFLGQD